MAVREDLVVPSEGEENYVLARDARIIEVPFSPLEERMAVEKPLVMEKLQILKEILGEEKFQRHISKVHNINYDGERIMIVAESELHRTNIERECLPAIIKAFEVKSIRIVAQG
ncbi:MAG: hypothetical protein LUD41_07095 [Phascolarctobacterium sp.]|nr:hypothetical protein [Phascolarctobacterium sp.]